MTVHGIAERKKEETRLRELLEEREVLLREIHHRIKNNLQIISGLLGLQSSSIQDEGVASKFRECQDRVYSIALLHETLYETGNLAKVDFPLYAEQLTRHLMSSYGNHIGHVDVDLEVKVGTLDLETAIPCGLIINELVSNCYKHAFPGGIGGRITLKMFRDKHNKVRLNVTDTGVEMRNDLDLENAQSIGLQLVRMLTQQLGGIAEVSRNGGTHFTIAFVDRRYEGDNSRPLPQPLTPSAASPRSRSAFSRVSVSFILSHLSRSFSLYLTRIPGLSFAIFLTSFWERICAFASLSV